jgi:uncharacterized membrane protein YuzA (DUF378 family)
MLSPRHQQNRTDMIESMFSKWLHLIAVALVVVGGLAWGIFGLTGVSVVSAVLGKTGSKAVYILVGLAAIVVALDRASFLPFLGETVMPCSLLDEHTPEHADTAVEIHGLTPGSKVLYWATEPATEGLAKINDWRRAYLDFANAGVTTADQGGHATLRVRKPQPYTVPMKGRLEAHVHWRVCGENGMVGPVQTTTLTGGPI